MPYWIQFSSNDKTDTHLVRYSTPGLGFTVEEQVTAKVYRMLQVAFECGKEEMKTEINNLLRFR